MTASPLDPLRPVFGDTLEQLAGTVIAGRLPLTADVVNRLIAQKLAAGSVPVSAADVTVHEGQAFSVRVRPKAPLPQVTVDFQIEHQPDFPERPTLALRWTLRGLGPLGLFAGVVLGYLRALPPAMQVDRDRVQVDLPTLMRDQGFAELVPLLTAVRVLTGEGRFVVEFEMRR